MAAVSFPAPSCNGTASSLATTLVSSTQVTAQVPASDIAAARVRQYHGSQPLQRRLQRPHLHGLRQSPAHSASLSLSTVTAGGAAFSLTVNGSGFVFGATVQWNGSSLATTFVSSTQLTAQVPASDIAAVGSANVTVLNPGSAASNALTFTVSAASIAPTGPTGRAECSLL